MGYKAIFLVLFLTLLIISCGQYRSIGKSAIQGKLIDIETNEPIIGASILVVGTRLGAQSDVDGNFIIKKINPGRYTLRISSIEYKTIVFPNVIVLHYSTTRVQSIKLTRKITEIDSIITVYSNRTTLDKDSIEVTKKRPVMTVDQILQQVTGEVFIRGGRAKEVSVTTDGEPSVLSSDHISLSLINQSNDSAAISESKTGGIKGKLTEKETGEPARGVSIYVVGTTRTVQSDIDGNFQILHLDPGYYTLNLSSVNYQDVVEGIKVIIASTTESNLQLVDKINELDIIITVTAKRDYERISSVSSLPVLPPDSIKKRPVQPVDHILQRISSHSRDFPTENIVKGSKADSVSFIVDSSKYKNNYTGQIKGKLTDKETGKPINSATVYLAGTTKGIKSFNNGYYILSDLEAGYYTLIVNSDEYYKFKIDSRLIISDSITTLNIQLIKK